jgi:DNA uptake protein ComE-like DNA-binding protein
MATEKDQTTPKKQATRGTAKQATAKPAAAKDSQGNGGTTTPDAAKPTRAGRGKAAASAAPGQATQAAQPTADTGTGGAKKRGPAKKNAAAGAAKSAGAAGAKKKSAMASGAAGVRKQGGLQANLREFVEQHPDGWGHDHWISLVRRLEEQGIDVQDRDSIGMMLENERMRLHLESVDGLSSKKVDAVVSQFGTVWNLRHASVEDLAALPGVTRENAEKILNRVR